VNPAAPTVTASTLLPARMSSPASDVAELTRSLARGDNEAWLRFHREFGPVLFRQLLAHTTGNYDVATEVLQQVYLRVARAVRACESEAEFRAWLRLVTRSTLHDSWRRQGAMRRLRERFRNDPPEEPAGGSERDDRLTRALDDALAAMRPEDCQLLTAKYFGGETVARIAERLHVPPKTVESRLTRARTDLRLRLVKSLEQTDAPA